MDKNDINVEQLKKETTNAVNEIKEQIKTVNIKEDTESTKGFIKNMFNAPIKTIKEIAESANIHSKTAILLIIVWILASVLSSINISPVMLNSLQQFIDGIIGMFSSVLIGAITPIISVAVLSTIIFVKDKNKSHSLMDIAITLVIANIPNIISEILHILRFLGTSSYALISPLSGLLYTISIVLTYFAIKYLFKKENDEDATKEFIIIYSMYFIASIIFRLLGISI